MRNRRRSIARPLTTLSLALLAVLLLVGGTPGTAAAEEPYTPTNGIVRVTGHGWGHGKGMSQYGAKQAATEGASSTQILEFYYPGTSVGSEAGDIRVRLDGAIKNIVTFKAPAGFEIYDTLDSSKLVLPAAPQYEVRADGNGKQNVFALVNGSWTFVKMLGAEAFAQAPTPFEVVNGGPGGLRGIIHVTTQVASGQYTLWPINRLSLEDYIRGVVPSEMPSSWGAAALQAQAVAARTYSVQARSTAAAGADYDICSTTSCQVYRGYGHENANTNAAIDATVGKILTYDGRPAFTQYSSSNGGFIAPGTVPYQQAKEDGWDKRSPNPYGDWNVDLTASQISQAYPAIGTLQRVVVVARDGGGDWGGRVTQMRLEGTSGNATVTGNAFRSKFGLRETYFTFSSPCGDGRFKDVPGGSQFCGDIIWMTDRQLTNGYSDSTFRPTAPVTRQALAAFMWRYEGSPMPASTTPAFSDVAASDQFFNAIQWMHGAGIADGFDDGTFRPLTTVSRQAIAAFLWRLEGSPPMHDTDRFADVTAGHPFYTAIQWMFDSELSTGTHQPPNKPLYKPADPLSRQAIAAFLHRYDGLEE